MRFLSNTRVYLTAEFTDLRKSYDTWQASSAILSGSVHCRDTSSSSPMPERTESRSFSGTKRAGRGAKRLEFGTRARPALPDPSMELSSEVLAFLDRRMDIFI
jgi:hypothetical protein